MFIVGFGAILFGLLIGWISYRILRHSVGLPWLSDLIVLLGIIVGAAVLALFRDTTIFGWYAIGLVIGFFAYLVIGVVLYGKQEVQPWRTAQASSPSTSDTQEAQVLAQPENGKKQTGRGRRSAIQSEEIL